MGGGEEKGIQSYSNTESTRTEKVFERSGFTVRASLDWVFG